MKNTNTNKRFSVKLFIISMIAANIISSVVFMNTADAKKAVKKYTKKITVTLKKGQKTKTLSLSKKLKKGDKITTKKVSSSDYGITVKRVSGKKVKISFSAKKAAVYGTTAVKLRTKKNGVITLKIKTAKPSSSSKSTEKKNTTYQSTNNGYTVTFSSASEKSYFDKIITELSSQLADPDKAALEVYGKKFKDGVPSEKKRIDLLQQYFKNHGQCNARNGEKTEMSWKDFYNGTFGGYCGDGATAGCLIARSLGFNARMITCYGIDHGWLAIETTDADNVKYWKGISVSSYAYNLSWNQTMIQDNNYRYNTYGYTYSIPNVTDRYQLNEYNPNNNW